MLNGIGTVIFIVLCVIVGTAGFLWLSELLSELRETGARFRNYFFKIIRWLLILFVMCLHSFILSTLASNTMEDLIKQINDKSAAIIQGNNAVIDVSNEAFGEDVKKTKEQ